MAILDECKCMRQGAKQGIEWAIDYHISSLNKELKEKEILVEQAKSEFAEITRREPGEYRIEQNIARLEREIKFYLDLRKEIIELPRCAEPAFEVQSGNPYRKELTIPEKHQLKIAQDTLKMSDAMVGVMGGPTKEQAREIIKELTGKVAKE